MNAEGGLPWEYLENAQSCVPLLVLLLLNISQYHGHIQYIYNWQ